MTGISGVLMDDQRNPTARPIRATVVESFDGHARITYPARGGQSSELVRLDQLVVVPQSHADRANAFHKDAVKAGRAAAEAGRKAGLELIAAKAEIGHGEWVSWCKVNLKFSLRTAQAYMKLAKSATTVAPHQTVREAASSTRPQRSTAKDVKAAAPPPRQEILRERLNSPEARARAAQAQQIDARRKDRADKEKMQFALDFIDTGYKAMSLKYHPDRGGSTDAQIIVTAVRDMLLTFVKNPNPCPLCG